jgi:hypothetical protein
MKIDYLPKFIICDIWKHLIGCRVLILFRSRIIMARYAYRIEELAPPLKRSDGYGFSVFLDREFAVKAKQQTIGQKVQNRLQEMASDDIKRMFFRQLVGLPYHFLDNSMLVTSCQVPGDNNCSLLIDRGQIDSLGREGDKSELHYYTHNVDNSDQALGLISLFTKWCGYAGLNR